MIRVSIFWKVLIAFLMYIVLSSGVILLIYRFAETPESISREIRTSLQNDAIILAAKAAEIISISGETYHNALQNNIVLKKLIYDCGKPARIIDMDGQTVINEMSDNKIISKYLSVEKISSIISKGIIIEGGHSGWFRSTVDISVPVLIGRQPVAILQVSYPKTNPERLRGNLLFGTLVEIATICILAFFMSKLLTAPVTKLKEGTKKMAEGALGYQVDIKSMDELGELGRNFNEMSIRISNMAKARMELTADISHELRSPLARIKIASEMLMADDTDEDDRKNYLKLINDEVDELNLLIGDLLELSKLELGKTKLDLWQVKIDDLVREVVAKVMPTALTNGLKINLHCDENIPLVLIDGRRIGRAISNIIDNSMKFVNSDGIIDITVLKKEDGVEISITDNGTGVSDNEMGEIFERFYRTDKSRNRETGGSGLGLAITKQIVEIHGGKIWAKRAELGGLKVIFSIPYNISLPNV